MALQALIVALLVLVALLLLGLVALLLRALGQSPRGLERPLQRIEAIRQQRGLELPPEGDHDFDDPALGVGSRRWGTVRWSSDQVTWAPDLAAADFNLEAIGGV